MAMTLDHVHAVVAGPRVAAAVAEERLPDAYRDALHTHVAPVAADVLARLAAADRPLLVGINGCQGSGKSTLARFLALIIEEAAGWRCPEVSIDDLYLTRAAREALGRDVHPLLVTRGVPGTHDLALGTHVLDALLTPERREPVAIPRFLKSIDDRAPPAQWTRCDGPVAGVLFEGWCVACPPQSAEALAPPVNALERDEDPDGRWRRYVNDRLASDYANLFARIDYLIFLRAPSFECVRDWRRKQERKLEARLRDEGAPAEAFSRVMNDAQLERFIEHYERLTRHMLATLGGRADAVIELDADHRLTAHRLVDPA